MSSPTLAQLRPDMLDDLEFLFKVCECPFDPAQPFNPDTSLVAFYEGQLVGFLTSWIDEQPYAWIDCFLVHPDFRGKASIALLLGSAMRELVLKRGSNAIRAVSSNPRLTAVLEYYGFTRRSDAVLLEWKQ